MNTITNRYRYVISDRLGTLQVQPLGESDFTIEWERTDEDQMDYEKGMPGKIVFIGEAYANLYKLEKSIYRCDYVNITIERQCGEGVWVAWLNGRLSLNDGSWDIDKCLVEVKLNEQKDDQCFTDNKGTEINLFEYVFARYSTGTVNPNIVIETVECYDPGPPSGSCAAGYYWDQAGNPYEQGYIPFYHDEIITGGGGDCHRRTRWGRQKLVQSCGEIAPGTDWILLSDTCPGGNRTYVKPVQVYNCVYTYPPSGPVSSYGYTMDCKVIGDSGTITELGNGLRLADVLNAFVNLYCPGIIIKSNFFNINATNSAPGPLKFSDTDTIIVNNSSWPNQIILQCTMRDGQISVGDKLKFGGVIYNVSAISWLQCLGDPGTSATITTDTPAPDGTLTDEPYEIYGPDIPINYVTGARSKTADILIFQKSDVKRPTDANATQAKTSFEKIITALTRMFNCKWRFENGYFIIEHVSFFSKNLGLDLTLPKFKRFTDGFYQYTYDAAKIPQQEVFTFMEAGNGDFKGLPIKYSGACVTTSSKDTTKTWAIDGITTDVQLCLDNPASDSPIVSDDGLVFVATQTDGVSTWIISEAPILGGSTLNNSLAWAQLHRDYHKYYRPLRKGNMNGQDTDFFSVEPTKKGTDLVVPLCCDDTFNPDDLVTTMIGQGTVDKATFSFKDETIKLSLMYAADEGLVDNTAPVANPDMASTYLNNPVIIDVLANDTDADPGSMIVGLRISLDPAHGAIVINPDNTITYTPNTGYSGDDYFTYQCVDNWGEYSNIALVAITIHPANQPPNAVNDSYSMNKGDTLTVPAPGVFDNDSDDISFTLDSYDATTTGGGTVSMAGDGSFSYTPASTSYVGTDTFTYTIIDGLGLTDTATVTITVLDPAVPIARDDSYATQRNTPLTVAAPGVMANDDTTAGPLAVVAATVTTAHGGTAQLYADGHFTYTPPTGYTGPDTFPYTVDNGTGTDTATITINVYPPLYVRLVRTEYHTQTIYNECSGGTQYGGEQGFATYKLYFYSNSAGTTPFDVTGLGIMINTKEVTAYRSTPSSTSFYTTGGATGSVFTMYNNRMVMISVVDCLNVENYYYNTSIYLEPGAYTII